MNYWFTGDEHLGHINERGGIIKYCNRPFSSIEEMDQAIIDNHNNLVQPGDVVIHAGDFSLVSSRRLVFSKYVQSLNGNHIFLHGDHDRWLAKSHGYIWRKRIEGIVVVVCHYAMRSWSCSHYNSWQLHAHHHGRLHPEGKQLDIGVDTNNYYPYSWDKVKEIMKDRPNNSAYEIIRRRDGPSDQD